MIQVVHEATGEVDPDLVCRNRVAIQVQLFIGINRRICMSVAFHDISIRRIGRSATTGDRPVENVSF